MSKLNTVRIALQSNADIQIVAVEETNHFPKPDGYWTHTVNFIVAPHCGIYTGKELQEFMGTLVPGLKPTMLDEFREWGTTMEFGKLYFDEELGAEVVRHELVLNDPDFLPPEVVENGTTLYEEERKLLRRTWVRLYPDQEIAMSHDRYTFNIPMADLKRFKARGHKLGFVGRIGKAITD